MTEVDKFRNAFIAVRDNGEYVSNRSGNTGIGKVNKMSLCLHNNRKNS